MPELSKQAKINEGLIEKAKTELSAAQKCKQSNQLPDAKVYFLSAINHLNYIPRKMRTKGDWFNLSSAYAELASISLQEEKWRSAELFCKEGLVTLSHLSMSKDLQSSKKEVHVVHNDILEQLSSRLNRAKQLAREHREPENVGLHPIKEHKFSLRSQPEKKPAPSSTTRKVQFTLIKPMTHSHSTEESLSKAEVNDEIKQIQQRSSSPENTPIWSHAARSIGFVINTVGWLFSHEESFLTDTSKENFELLKEELTPRM